MRQLLHASERDSIGESSLQNRTISYIARNFASGYQLNLSDETTRNCGRIFLARFASINKALSSLPISLTSSSYWNFSHNWGSPEASYPLTRIAMHISARK